VFGWQGLNGVRYPELGLRLFGYCDIPDLELFPDRYRDLRSLRFVAGHEVKLCTSAHGYSAGLCGCG